MIAMQRGSHDGKDIDVSDASSDSESNLGENEDHGDGAVQSLRTNVKPTKQYAKRGSAEYASLSKTRRTCFISIEQKMKKFHKILKQQTESYGQVFIADLPPHLQSNTASISVPADDVLLESYYKEFEGLVASIEKVARRIRDLEKKKDPEKFHSDPAVMGLAVSAPSPAFSAFNWVYTPVARIAEGLNKIFLAAYSNERPEDNRYKRKAAGSAANSVPAKVSKKSKTEENAVDVFLEMSAADRLGVMAAVSSASLS